jgi:hypothetical protein
MALRCTPVDELDAHDGFADGPTPFTVKTVALPGHDDSDVLGSGNDGGLVVQPMLPTSSIRPRAEAARGPSVVRMKPPEHRPGHDGLAHLREQDWVARKPLSDPLMRPGLLDGVLVVAHRPDEVLSPSTIPWSSISCRALSASRSALAFMPGARTAVLITLAPLLAPIARAMPRPCRPGPAAESSAPNLPWSRSAAALPSTSGPEDHVASRAISRPSISPICFPMRKVASKGGLEVFASPRLAIGLAGAGGDGFFGLGYLRAAIGGGKTLSRAGLPAPRESLVETSGDGE